MSNPRCELFFPSSGGPPILIGGSIGSATIATRFVPFIGKRVAITLSTEETKMQWPIPSSGVLANFRAHAGTVSTLTATTILTLRRNALDTPVVFTFDAAAGANILIATPVSVVAGDLLCYRIVSAAPTGIPAAEISITAEFTP